jgi:glutamate-1-semialdehyde 2,1-aminomutase
MMDLERRVSTARADYVAAHPTSRAWFERASHVMPAGNTRSVLHFDPFPIRVAQAEGKYLHDVDGHRYVDLLGNYTAGLFGHSDGQIAAAIHKAVDRGFTLGAPHEDEVLLAESIVERFPSIERVRFTNSGTEANLMALAAALFRTGRDGVLVFDGAYHGGLATFGSSGREVNVPHRWVLARYNDLGSVRAVVENDGGIGAILVEPMQGAAGAIAADVDFLFELRELAHDHGIVLIFDEVMTSRLWPGGLQQRHDVIPDMTTLGKYLAGGMSFGAFGGSLEAMSPFEPGGGLGHAGTFNNNVLSMAAGIVANRDVLSDAVLEDLNARGDRLRLGLNEAFEGISMCATGTGSIIGVHPVRGPVMNVDDARGGDERLRELWFFASLEAGFYVARRGFLSLSLEVGDDDVDRYLGAVGRWATALVQP